MINLLLTSQNNTTTIINKSLTRKSSSSAEVRYRVRKSIPHVIARNSEHATCNYRAGTEQTETDARPFAYRFRVSHRAEFSRRRPSQHARNAAAIRQTTDQICREVCGSVEETFFEGSRISGKC